MALVAYAVLMPLVLVWAGEHYVVDTLLGALYAGAVVVLAARARPVVRQLAARLRSTVAGGSPHLPWGRDRSPSPNPCPTGWPAPGGSPC